MLQTSLNKIWEQLGLELVALLSALAWALLRVARVIVRDVSQGKAVKIEIAGKEILHILTKEEDIPLIQQGKEKIEAIEESDTHQGVSLMLF